MEISNHKLNTNAIWQGAIKTVGQVKIKVKVKVKIYSNKTLYVHLINRNDTCHQYSVYAENG